MLDAIGLPAAVLDGGIQAWPGELETGPADDPNGPPVDTRPWPDDRFVVADEVERALAAGAVLVDARSAERFRGEPNPVDSRPGHIPGAISRPWTDNVGPDGRFLPVEDLRHAFEELGIGQETALVASCGSGVTGCHDLLAARLIGLDGGRLYTGSWSEWALDTDRPVATGAGGDGTGGARPR
jgi:thiosulfate/3-mercaptopyruvate sulfurtransferase